MGLWNTQKHERVGLLDRVYVYVFSFTNEGRWLLREYD